MAALHATLDPVRLLSEMRAAQQHLVDFADHPLETSAMISAPPIEEFLAGLRTAWRDGEVRPTAQLTAKQKRGRRRTRPVRAGYGAVACLVRSRTLADKPRVA